jgi:hypothetical protein
MAEEIGPDRELGEGFPQIVHDRARRAAEELHKLFISLSTAANGVYFIALTGKIEPPLSKAQRLCTVVALLAMAGALGCGLLAWYADARRNFFWASAMQAEGRKRKELLQAAGSMARRQRRISGVFGICIRSGRALFAWIHCTAPLVDLTPDEPCCRLDGREALSTEL